jgi:hypothetical protein
LTEIFAFVFTIAYIYGFAHHKRSSAKWELDGDIKNKTHAPAFALFGNYNDAASAIFTGEWTKCYFPRWTDNGTTSCEDLFRNKARTLENGPFGHVNFYTFNALGAQDFTSATDELLLQTTVKCMLISHAPMRGTNLTGDSHKISQSYNTSSPQYPTLYSIMYDPRLTFNDFKAALQCGILGWTEQPALGSNTYTIDETVRTFDELGKISPSSNEPLCTDLTARIYALEEGYAAYRYHLSSSGAFNATACDLNGTDSIAQPCTSQVLIRYGSFKVSSMKSVPGMEKVQMLIDVGAIVGAVAYVGWYLTIFQ